MINKFEKKVLETIRKYNMISKGDNIIVAVSGGPDSMALLNSLINLEKLVQYNKLVVCHVNHMLREEADEETEFVKDFCKKNGIECYVKYCDINKIAKEKKIGLEEAGRYERYNFFEEIKEKENINKIAVAHNKKDNSETVLMHIIRGAGVTGLSGIKPVRDKIYIRPIIKCSREEIEDYLKNNKIEFRTDKSNAENEYTRNKVRNRLIPFIEKEFNSNIVDSLDRLSEIVSEEQDFINEVAKKEYKRCIQKESKDCIIFDLKKFNSINKFIRKQLILEAIYKVAGNNNNVEKVNLDDIIKICENNVGNKKINPNKKIEIYVKSGFLKIKYNK